MSKRTPRLGKGLEALLAGTSDERPGDVVAVGTEAISPNPFQPRRTFDEEKLRELADSIGTHGVVQPIIVRRSGDAFQLVAGERRWRAAKLAGLDEIPALVEDLGDRDVMEIALIENLQREDLSPVEEARAYEVLQKEFSLTQRELAQRVGVSRSQVANVLRLLQLPEEIQGMIQSGLLSMGHAKIVLGLEEDLREGFASEIAERGWSVREAEKAATRVGTAERPRSPKPPGPTDVFLRDIERRLTSALNSRVNVRSSGKRGKIVIEYRDIDDLERLLATLGVEDDG